MPRKTASSRSARHILIEDEDWELLDQMFGPRSVHKTGIGNVICRLVHRVCEDIRAKQNAAAQGPSGEAPSPQPFDPAEAPNV